MDKGTARDLLPLVNDPDTHGRLSIYAESRINELALALESTTDLPAIYRIQGRIAEMRRLKYLRDEVRRDAE